MASSIKTLTPFSILLVILTISTQTHFSFSIRETPLKSTSDVHEVLSLYGFPKGLLPNNVKSYTLSDDGSFEIELESECYVKFDLLVYYDKKIKGKLSYGSVSDVSGIQAKKLFLWVSVSGIKANQGSGTIDFYVGILSETLPAQQFQKIPACRKRACLGERSEAATMWGTFDWSFLDLIFLILIYGCDCWMVIVNGMLFPEIWVGCLLWFRVLLTEIVVLWSIVWWQWGWKRKCGLISKWDFVYCSWNVS